METIEQIVSRVLKERNLSQNKLGELMGVSGAQVSDVLSGNSKPGLKFCKGLAAVAHLPEEYVLEAAKQISPKGKSSPLIEETIYIARQLPENDQADLLDLARAKLRRHERTEGNIRTP
jgi:transcriptional regulator with XRE-family HTH domain